MAKVKGKKKLNKAVSATLKPFGIRKAKVHKEYAYFLNNSLVTFKITEGSLEDDWFIEFVKERFDYDVKLPFIFSILHEVGHHKTLEDVYANDDLYNFCISEKKRIDKEMKTLEDETLARKLEFEYFNLPDEIIATAWAVSYMKNHPKKVKKMWEKCQKALMEFYKTNKINFED